MSEVKEDGCRSLRGLDQRFGSFFRGKILLFSGIFLGQYELIACQEKR